MQKEHEVKEKIEVKVKIEAVNSRKGFRSLLDTWDSVYPDATLQYVSVYGASSIIIQLELPLGTKVIQPRLVDLTAKEIEDGGGH